MKIKAEQSPKSAMYKRVPNRDRDPRGHFPSTKTRTLLPYWCELDRAALVVAEADPTIVRFERCNDWFAAINENGERFEFDPFILVHRVSGRRCLVFCGNNALAVKLDPAVRRAVAEYATQNRLEIEAITIQTLEGSPALDNANLIVRFSRPNLTDDMVQELEAAYGDQSTMPLYLLERAMGERLANSPTICTAIVVGLIHFDIHQPLKAETPFSFVKKEFGHA